MSKFLHLKSLIFFIYGLSYFLNAEDHLPGYMALFFSFTEGISNTSMGHPGFLMFTVLGIGNIFMILSLFFPKNLVIISGLALQVFLSLIVMSSTFTIIHGTSGTWVGRDVTMGPSGIDHYEIGFYLWAGSQICMCLLSSYLWLNEK